MSTSSPTKGKVNRIDLRITPQQKEKLERAAAIKGLSLSAYMLSQSLEAADSDIASHLKLVLSDRDRDLFLSLMENPPSPEEALVKGMKKFQEEYEDQV